MDILSKLFGSDLKVRMMRLFLFNPGEAFDAAYVAGKTGERPAAIEKEAIALRKLGLVKPAKVSRIATIKKGKKTIEKKMSFKAWTLDQKFPIADALADFLSRTHSFEKKNLVKRIEKAGRIKAVLVSGIFLRQAESRLDLFIIGDGIKSSSIDRVVKGIESDMGKEIRYAVLSAPDFAYRVSMNDKLVRDIMDFPHEVLVDKIGISNA